MRSRPLLAWIGASLAVGLGSVADAAPVARTVFAEKFGYAS